MADGYRGEYLARIHRAQDYIETHLGEELKLEDIARAAHFSSFHFHRLYTALTGETLYQFILRIRLERAAGRLCQSMLEPVTNIALDVGFSSAATFARAFKEHFGVSASEYRVAMESKIRKMVGKDGKAEDAASLYLDGMEFKPATRSESMKPVAAKSIEVRELSAKTLAYLRHVGPYAGDAELFGRLWGKMCAWAGPRGLLQPPQTEMITIYHDNPEVTEPQKLRMSLGVTVPADTPVSGEFALLTIPAGKYACALFEIDPADYGAAWQAVMGEWLPQSGWQPDDNPAYECYFNDPEQHPQHKHIVEIRMGVKPL